MIILFFIIAINIFVLSKLVFMPYPEFFVYPYLTNHGLLPYRDILDQHFPGLMFLPINLGNLGMTTPAAARFWQYGIVVAIQILIFIIGRQIFKSEKKALLANLLFLVWQPFFEGWVLWIDSILPIFLLPAFYFAYSAYEKGKKKDLLLSGLFLGVSLVFKQVVGPLALIVFTAIYFKRKNIKDLMWFLIGFLPLPVIMIFYILSKGVFPDFWYWTVVFNLTTFAKYGREGGTIKEILKVSLIYGYALLSFFEKKLRSLNVWLLIFAVGALFSSNARFDLVHFQPSLPFICLGTAIALNYLWIKNKYLILVYFAVAVFLLINFYRANIGTKVYFFEPQDYRITERIKELTKPGEKIFLFGTPFNYYQITGTIPAGNVFVFQFPWFMMVSEDKVLSGLAKDMPKLVVADRTDTTDGVPITKFASKINDFLVQNYVVYDRMGQFEFLKPKGQYAYFNRH